MLLLVATVACSQSSTCNATQRSDWSVGGGLIKEITGCKDFGACCSYCTSTELPHCLRHTGGTKLPCQCPLESRDADYPAWSRGLVERLELGAEGDLRVGRQPLQPKEAPR